MKVKIRDIADVIDGPHATPHKTKKGPFYLGIDAVLPDGTIDLTKSAHLSEKDWKKWTKKVNPQQNDIVFSYEATLGRYAIISHDFKGALGRRLAIIRIKRNDIVDTHWLYYFFKSSIWEKYISQRIVYGSTVTRIPVKDYPDYELELPPIEEQRRISGLLRKIDKKIVLNKNFSKELESMAKTIYDYWFLQFEFPDKDGKPYKSNGGKMVWNDQLKQEIPEGWEVSIVKNILGDYPRTKTIESKEYNSGSLYPIIDQSKDSYICGYTDNKDYVLNLDDAIVFGDHSNKSKYVNFPFARGADGTQILNSNNPRLPNYLLYQEIIALPEIEKGYSRHFKFLKAQNITIPTLDITKKYMSIVSNMLLQQRKIIKENQQLHSLRDFLLPMLMNGQVIIED